MPSPEVMETGYWTDPSKILPKNLLSGTLAASINTKSPLEKIKESRWQQILASPSDLLVASQIALCTRFLSHCQSITETELLMTGWVPNTYVISYWAPLLSWYLCYMTWFFFLLCILKRKFNVVENLKLPHTAEEISLPRYQPSRCTVIISLTLLEFFVSFLGTRYW